MSMKLRSFFEKVFSEGPNKNTHDQINELEDTWHKYYKDPNRVEVLIKYSFRIPSKIENFSFDDHPLHVRQDGSEIHVNQLVKIPQSLLNDVQKFFEDFKKGKEVEDRLVRLNPSRFIVGYMSLTFPRINQEINARKYKEGHLILKNVSPFDISNCFVVDSKGTFSSVLWPLPLPKFQEIPTEADLVFVRDFIDAMSEYFYYNLDECIRKVITSLENYFRHYDLKPTNQDRSISKFKRIIDEYITEDFYSYKDRDLKIVRENIWSVYQGRNNIVHDKLRLDPHATNLCRRAIGTLVYIYQSSQIKNDGTSGVISLLNMHFNLVAGMVLGLHLEKFEKADQQTDTGVISNEDEMNEWVFSRLQFSPEEKEALKAS